MRLTRLLESSPVWYHGTPDGQNFNGTFEQRTLNVSYITDFAVWNDLQTQMANAERGSAEYFKLLDQVGKLRANKSIRAPIFFSNNMSVARTYADDSRSFDYQNADPRVISATIKDAPTLVVGAYGQNFRGITIASFRAALSRHGISDDKIDAALGQFANHIRGDGNKLSTDSMAMIAQDMDFELIDVTGVKDTYSGGGPPATVRMVLDPSLIEITQDR